MTAREIPVRGGPMVRAILDGRKTQTRRVILPQPNLPPDLAAVCSAAWEAGEIDVRCPYGQPGDRLWVRETWGLVTMHSLTHPVPPRGQVVYRAGKRMGVPVPGTRPIEFRSEWRDDFTPTRWRPSIHMPRRYSRLTLELTGVRVERVQDISESDCEAEGVFALPDQVKQDAARRASVRSSELVGARSYYCELWDSLNAARGYGWDTNPWVWVIEFRRVEQGGAS